MKFYAPALLFLSALPSLTYAKPIEHSRINDVAIVNYALTLGHLQSAFYTGALAQFDDHAFIGAGYSLKDRERFVDIAKYEATHVAFLEGSLGPKATKPCTYRFPYTDVRSFVALSQTLEGVGLSTYLGATTYPSKKGSAHAPSIHGIEGHHSAWISAIVRGLTTWGALDTTSGLKQIYNLSASMIASCPSTNPTLPVKAFPTLCFEGDVSAGSNVAVSFASSDPRAGGPAYVAFFYGLDVDYVPLLNGCVVVPTRLSNFGQVYAVVTSVNGRADDSTILAGPAIVGRPRHTSLTHI